MSSIVISGDSSGTVSLTVPSAAGTNTATLPAATGTVMVSGNMPAFSAYAGSVTSLTSSAEVKILFDTEEFDTNNNFASSRFTPTVSGYYQINGAVRLAALNASVYVQINKNGSAYKIGTLIQVAASYSPVLLVSSVVYLNGSTDYVEIYAFQNSGSSQNTTAGSIVTWFNGSLVRAA